MSTPRLSPRSFRSRIALIGTFALVVAGVSLGGVAGAAAAACVIPVSEAGDLAAATNDSGSDGCTIVLDDDITDAGSFNVVTSLAIDLGGNALSLGGISSTDGITLTIEDSGSGGTFTTTATGNFNPGIQIGPDSSLIVDSGAITANGSYDAPGIGGGFHEASGDVTVNGGTVQATGDRDAAGIGGGESDNAGTYTQTGGTVTAIAGPGTDTSGGAGVGGGLGGTSGAVNISGGTLTATGGAGGAGIGSGTDVDGPDVTITGGTVTATGNGGAGIGSGNAYNLSDNVSSGTFTMSAGTVTASSSNGGAGIGGGNQSASGTISVTGGSITATGGDGAAGIGGGAEADSGSITISSASVTATGTQFSPAIGSGEDGNAGAIDIGTGADVTVSTTSPGESHTAIGAEVGGTLASLEIAGTVHVPANNWVVIQSGATATIDSTGLLEGAGTLSGTSVSSGGTVVNNGVIDMGDVWDALRTDGYVGLTVTGNDYLETFVPNASDTPPIEGTTSVRLYAPSFAVAGSDHQPPVYAAHPGEIFAGWSNGGTAFTTSTPISADATWTGTWHTVTSLTVSAITTPLGAGQSSQLTVTGSDGLGDFSNQSPWASITSNIPSDVITNGDGTNPPSIEVTKSGDHLLTASVPINNGDATVGGTGTITVTTSGTGVPPIGFANAPSTAYVGDTYDFTLSTLDQYGNAISSVHATLKSSSSADSVHGMSVKFGSTGTHTITATAGSHKYTKTVHVIKDTPVVTLSGPSSQTAGVQSTFTVAAAAGPSGELPKGTVRLYYTTSKYVSVSVSNGTATTVHLTLTLAEDYSIHATFEGSSTYLAAASASQPYEIDAAAAKVPNKLVFLSTQTSVVYDVWTSTAVALVDPFGNPIPGSGDTAVITSDGDQSTSAVRYTTLGHHLITATVGLTSVSKTVNVIKDTPSIVVSVPTLSVPTTGDTFGIEISTGTSGLFVAGDYVLHFGSFSEPEQISAPTGAFGNPFGLGTDLPYLAPGKYVAYATYAGSGIYNAASTPKVTVTVSPGPLDHLKFISPATSAVAGQPKTFVVDGYDAENDLIGPETAATDSGFALSLVGGSLTSEVVTGNTITFAHTGARMVEATSSSGDGPDVTIPITVVAGAVHSLNFRGPVPLTAASPASFNIYFDGSDIYGNAVPDPTAHVKVHSSFASDVIKGNIVKFTQAGTRHLTFSDGAATGSIDFPVSADSPADKITFGHTFAPKQFAYVNQPYSIAAFPSDQFGNIDGNAHQLSDTGFGYSITGSHYVISSPIVNLGGVATFSTTGERTITAYLVESPTETLRVHETVDVIKDTATISFPTASVETGVDTLTVTVTAGGSGVDPTGTVTLHYGSHSLGAMTLTPGSGSSTATYSLPPAGTYSFYATYSGDAGYSAATGSKHTIIVTS
jgi:hypothetical protein